MLLVNSLCRLDGAEEESYGEDLLGDLRGIGWQGLTCWELS